MSSDTSAAKLHLLRRFKEECLAVLYSYERLNEGLKAGLAMSALLLNEAQDGERQ